MLRPPLSRDRLTRGANGRVFWALKRLYDDPEMRARRLGLSSSSVLSALNVVECDRCGGKREVRAFILRPAELKRICAHLGYPTEAPLAQVGLWNGTQPRHPTGPSPPRRFARDSRLSPQLQMFW